MIGDIFLWTGVDADGGLHNWGMLTRGTGVSMRSSRAHDFFLCDQLMHGHGALGIDRVDGEAARDGLSRLRQGKSKTASRRSQIPCMHPCGRVDWRRMRRAGSGRATMGLDAIVLVLLGALAGGFVNGLTGFGTGITAMGLWLYALSPPVAASLVIICSVVSQLQTLPMIWRAIEWRRVLPFVVPGLVGVPIGTRLLSQVDPRTFKIGVGLFLVVYATHVLARRMQAKIAWGGQAADGVVGFAGGVLGGLTGFSAVPPIVWTDIRGYTKEQRRSILQAFNLSILSAALASHAYAGLLTSQVGLAAMTALPGTIGGAWAGSRIYRRLGDRDFQRLVMVLLLVSGAALVWTSW